MYATYTLKKDELNIEFIENLKKLIPTDEVLLSIESFDETDYLMESTKNKEILLERIKYVEEGKDLVEVSREELKSIL